jgi:photosystem II stability/assembly factor-like uncharacterized protein
MFNKKLFLVPVLAIVLSGCAAPAVKMPVITPTKPGGFDAKTEAGSLWKTSDGGQSFQVKSQVDEKSRISNADILSITYHPAKPATIYVSTVDTAIFKTENGGENWAQIPFPPKRIYSFILDRIDPDNRMFASGVLGNWAKIFRTDDGGQTWREVYTEPGQATVVTALAQNPRNTNVIFAGTSVGTVVKSIDGGATWKNIGSKVNGVSADFSFDAKKPLVTYLLMYGQKVYYSPDGGAQWLDWEMEKPKEIQSLQAAATRASSKGKVKDAARIRKQAQELSVRNQTNRMPAGIVSIATDSNVSGVIYAGTSAGLFRSTDFGKYWTELNIIESAKKFPIRSIAVDPKNPKEIVFVAGKAFYKSVDGGGTWATVGLNVDRDASFVSYDPFDSKYLFIGLRKFAKQ